MFPLHTLSIPSPSDCRMYVDDEYIMEVPTASLVRCRHPRTAAGWQYQLYGVQDFRRKYEGNQLKITKLERAADEAPNVCDIYFVNISGPLLLTNHEANKYEGPKGPVPASYRLAPIVPISFVLKSFFGYPEEGAAEGDALSTNVASEMKDTSSLGSDVLDHFPIKIQLAIELNKELLEEVHACEIAHDPKSQVFRLMEDKPVSLALKGYSLLISGWTKKEGNLIVMSCSGTLRAIDNKPPSSKKRSRSLAGGGEQEQDATEALANEAIAMAMTSLLPQGLGGNPFGLGGSNAETEALLAQLFSNPEALANAVASAGALFQPASFDLSSLGDPAALAAVLMANPPPAESDLNAVEGADAVSGLMALIQSATAAGAVVEAVPPSTDADRAAEADAGP